jgi:NADPH-dependent curcumin reductase CurA
MTDVNTRVVLARRPDIYPQNDDFAISRVPMPQVEEGMFLTRNLYLSLDAGFRNWMNESSGDNVLPAMALNEPVMGLTLSRVIESRNPDYQEGDLLMARFAWEEYSLGGGDEFIVKLPSDLKYPLSYYLGILGDTGMSAYFGLTDVAKPKPGETVVISAAGGAVGSIAGQIASLMGARTVGISSSVEKCQRLIDELGYDACINRNSTAGLRAAIAAECPGGVDVYFDSVGGETLEAIIDNLSQGDRIALCGSITHYNSDCPATGPGNLFELVTKEATMQGFMTHFREDRYPEARQQLEAWIESGELNSIEYFLDGIESAGIAFCDLFSGRNFGKTIVRLFPDDQG